VYTNPILWRDTILDWGLESIFPCMDSREWHLSSHVLLLQLCIVLLKLSLVCFATCWLIIINWYDDDSDTMMILIECNFVEQNIDYCWFPFVGPRELFDIFERMNGLHGFIESCMCTCYAYSLFRHHPWLGTCFHLSKRREHETCLQSIMSYASHLSCR